MLGCNVWPVFPIARQQQKRQNEKRRPNAYYINGTFTHWVTQLPHQINNTALTIAHTTYALKCDTKTAATQTRIIVLVQLQKIVMFNVWFWIFGLFMTSNKEFLDRLSFYNGMRTKKRLRKGHKTRIYCSVVCSFKPIVCMLFCIILLGFFSFVEEMPLLKQHFWF